MKKSNVFIWVIAILALIAVYMLGRYFWQFAENGWSNDPVEWGAFGSYMGAITGLLAFVGVLYSIHNANKKSAEAKEEAEKVRKEAAAEDKKIREEAKIESEKLRVEARARDERDLFFKLMEENQKTLTSLIFPAEKKEDVTHGINALESYVKDINMDFQLLIVLASSRGCKTYQEWINKITPQEIHDQETVAYFKVYKDLINMILEVVTPSIDKANAASLYKADTEQLQHAQKCYKYIRKQLDDVEKGNFDTEKFYIAEILEPDHLAIVARWIWWHSDNLGRFRALEYTANVFYKKYLNEIIYHFNNVGYLIYTINSFVGRDKDFM